MSSRPGDPGVLCCCEYENSSGERSHILACCCDCQALDEAADRCLTCKPVPNSTMHQVKAVFLDRCRVPWCSGKGAVKIRIDVLVPIVMVPLCLFIATLGVWTTVLVLTFMPLFMIGFYQVWRRSGHHQTDFFFVWGLTSVLFCFLVFCSFVLAFREILLWEILLLFTCLALMFYYTVKVRLNPGRVNQKKRRETLRYPALGEKAQGNGDVKVNMNGNGAGVFEKNHQIAKSGDKSGLPSHQVLWVDSRPMKDGTLQVFCSDCNIHRPPRSGHCTVCKTCIPVRDHHCVWVNTCIGAKNHRSFLMAMLLFIFCGFYGSHLTLTTVCTPEMYLDWLLLPSDCRFLYSELQNSLPFVSVCYTLLCSAIMSVGLVHQIILISQNITSQELHQASRRGLTRLGLYARNNVNNHGLLRNWVEFLMADERKASPTIPS